MIKKLDFPISRCTLDLTERCNLRCKYCFTYGIGKRDLSYEQGKKTIDWLFTDEISQSDDISIDWWGGEPFIKFELMKRLTDYALEKAHKTKKRLMIGGTSNVTLWKPEVVDWMNKHRIYFLMSIDGVGEVQDKFRPLTGNKSSWNVIKKRLPYIVRKIPFIRSRCSPTPETMPFFINSVRELYNTWKIKEQMFSPVFEMEWKDRDIEVAKDQLFQLADFIIELKKKGENLAVKHLDDGARKLASPNPAQREWPCGAGRFYVGISVDGYIYPCHRFNKYGHPLESKYVLGSIDEGITRPDLREPFLHFMDYPVPEKCKDCEWLGLTCQVACYAINYDLTGNVCTPPKSNCAWMEAQGSAIKYFFKKLRENNLEITGFNQQPIPRGGMGMGSCICNNMCYLESTEHEIKNVDWETSFSCHCYNTNYVGGLSDQSRQLTYEEMIKIKPRVTSRNEVIEKLDNLTKVNKELVEAVLKLVEEVRKK